MIAWSYQHPFHHFRIQDALDPGRYRAVCEVFDRVRAGSEAPRYRMARSNPNYDALVLAVDAALAARLTPLFSPDWLQVLHRFLGFPCIGRIDGALHSSPAGSRDGWIHTDLCPVWFDESRPAAGALRFPDRARCEYFSGRRLHPEANAVEYVRAAVLIYFLCNDGWRPGEGGETGLYAAARQDRETRWVAVPPLNNSMLLFPCSPHSYHRFLSNPGRARNSVVIWLHSTVQHAQSLWGAAAVPRRPPVAAAALA